MLEVLTPSTAERSSAKSVQGIMLSPSPRQSVEVNQWFNSDSYNAPCWLQPNHKWENEMTIANLFTDPSNNVIVLSHGSIERKLTI